MILQTALAFLSVNLFFNVSAQASTFNLGVPWSNFANPNGPWADRGGTHGLPPTSSYGFAGSTAPASSGSTASALQVVSAASYRPQVSPDSLASIFGTSFSTETVQPSPDASGSFPLVVAGVTVLINGVQCPIIYASPTQINIYIPPNVALGNATVSVTSSETGQQASGTVAVQNVAPGIFYGPPDHGAILNAITFQPDPFTVQTQETDGSVVETQIAAYATGTRYAGNPSHDPSITNVASSVSAQAVDSAGKIYPLAVEYAGAAPGFVGLDQINITVPPQLDGVGVLWLSIGAGSQSSNTVELTVRSQASPTVTSFSGAAAPPGSPITVSGAGFADGVGSTGLARTSVIFSLPDGEQVPSLTLSVSDSSIQALVPPILDQSQNIYQGSAQLCVVVDSQESCAKQAFVFQPLVQPAGAPGDTVTHILEQSLQSAIASAADLDPGAVAALQLAGNDQIQQLQTLIQQVLAGDAPMIPITNLDGTAGSVPLDITSLNLIESLLAANPDLVSGSGTQTAKSAHGAHATSACSDLPDEQNRATAKVDRDNAVSWTKAIGAGTFATALLAASGAAACVALTGGSCAGPVGTFLSNAASALAWTPFLLVPSTARILWIDLAEYNYLQSVPDVTVTVPPGQSATFNVNATFTKSAKSAEDTVVNLLTSQMVQAIPVSLPPSVYQSATNLAVQYLAKPIGSLVATKVLTSQWPSGIPLPAEPASVELGGDSLTALASLPGASLDLACGTPGSMIVVPQDGNGGDVPFSIADRFLAVPPPPGTTTLHVIVSNPMPTITSLSPSSLVVGSPAQTLNISGTGFITNSTVTFNDITHTPSYIGTTQLTIELSTDDLADVGTFPVIVTNPMPGGGTSNAVSFSVTDPVPAITSLTPSYLAAGSPAQTLTISGTGFVTNSTVTFNDITHTPSYIGTTQLTIELTADDLADVGTFPVIVTNPLPGGGLSNAVSFTVATNFSGTAADGTVSYGGLPYCSYSRSFTGTVISLEVNLATGRVLNGQVSTFEQEAAPDCPYPPTPPDTFVFTVRSGSVNGGQVSASLAIPNSNQLAAFAGTITGSSISGTLTMSRGDSYGTDLYFSLSVPAQLTASALTTSP
ncbi:MAG: IPT/TIG domain-containing protein [Bryobacteraceae bacterium]